MRNVVLGAVALFVVIGVVGAVARSGGSKDNNTDAATGTVSVVVITTVKATGTITATPSAAATAGAALPIQDGDWRLEALRTGHTISGHFKSYARITYTGQDTDGGSNVFALTVFKDGKTVGLLNGSVKEVAPGKTVTVQFLSADWFVSGPYEYDFQKQR
ncbi:MAG: hypothetical protein ABJA87_01535 [bacterium]